MLRALEGLWSVRPPVTHGNIAPGNVLLTWPPPNPNGGSGGGGAGVWLAGVGGGMRVRRSLIAEGYLPPNSASGSSDELGGDLYGVGAVMLRLVSGIVCVCV